MGEEIDKVRLKNQRTDKILDHRMQEIELLYQKKIEYENLKHEHIMEEIRESKLLKKHPRER